MKKIHLCCGDVYLDGYENCDIASPNAYVIGKDADYGRIIDPTMNRTTLKKYFKFPFKIDVYKRVRRDFILDREMNILEEWEWEDSSVDEIVMISGFEHFEHLTEIPHIVHQAYRVLKPGGVWKFDFPDIYNQVKKYHGKNDEFMMELIYCNHKNKYSVHQWGYTKKTIPNYLKKENWKLKFGDIVKHDYPMIGVSATKI